MSIEDDWDIEELAKQLKEEKWLFTEKGVINRAVIVCTVDTLDDYLSKSQKRESYIKKLATKIGKIMKEKNVYGDIDDDDVYIAQSVKGSIDDLKKKYEIINDDEFDEVEEEEENEEDDEEDDDWEDEDEEDDEDE